MKKFICILLSTLLLCASLTIGVFAATAPEFKLNTKSASDVKLQMTSVELEAVTENYFNTFFDADLYDATFCGAYRAALTVDGAASAFTDEMSVSIVMDAEYINSDIFVFYITPESTISEKLPVKRAGTTLTIAGEDFEAAAGNIIVIMTAPISPIIPAAVCAGVAVLAIIISIVVVKKKKASAGLVEQE